MMLSVVLGLLVVTSLQAFPLNQPAEAALEFIILHNNDMHARFDQTSQDSGTCTPADAAANKCYGGFARVAYELRKYRAEAQNGGKPVVYLNAGDTYTGTPWFTVFKDNITAAMLNKLQPDVVSLGNHEFDEGVEGLVPFLNKANFPVVAANLNLTLTPEMAATKSLKNHTVIEVQGVKIGVIGYITPETEHLVKPNLVRFTDEVKAINAEAELLKKQGINIIIALGHSGYKEDQEIALQCPDVDLVIGGHSHSFLYTGTPPDSDVPVGPYPTIVKRSNGVEVPVVQSYAFTKYLGKLHVMFDAAGNLIEFDGRPILLNGSVPMDKEIADLIETYRPNITALEANTVGRTKVYLEGSAAVCRTGECNMGNVVADSMVYARVLEEQGGAYWTDAAIAIMGGGGVRNSIQLRSDGSITGADLMTVLPFNNKLIVTRLLGKTLRKSLEHSAYLKNRDSSGGFLQMSGIHVTYDFNREVGSRVVDVQVRCAECLVPHYEPLNDTKLYKMVVPSFLYEEGDGHVVKEPDTVPITLRMNDLEALTAYVQSSEFVYTGLEGRIVDVTCAGSTASRLSIASLSILIILKLLL